MIYLTRKFSFCAAHHLPHHKGKCKNSHGHSYKLVVTVKGETLRDGLLVDFGDFKNVVGSWLDMNYDHKNLNTFIANPTSEIIAMRMFNELKTIFENMCVTVHKVRLYESDTSYTDYFGGDVEKVD